MSGYLVLTELFGPSRGGTAVWFAEVYARLDAPNNVILTAEVPGDLAFDAGHPAQVRRLALARVPWLRPESLLMYGRLLWHALWAAGRRRFTAIHAGRALPEGLVALMVGRLTQHEVLIYAHGEELTGWGQGYKFRAMRWTLRHADRVIANSDRTRDLLLAMGVATARIALIYPGVDCDHFSPGPALIDLHQALKLPPTARIVLSVGRLQRRKGFGTVLAALPALLAAGLDLHYVVVGSGEVGEELLASAAALGLKSRFHLLQHVRTAELPDCYRSCEVFAMPNIDLNGDMEGFGMVYLEAAACGKPSLAGTAGGTGSAVIDGETGLRVDGDSLAAVTAGLRRLLSDADYAAALGARGLARARASFDWSRVAALTGALAAEAATLHRVQAQPL
jgi:phosphatidylinositol alpha-1,6-mannosyltransferase